MKNEKLKIATILLSGFILLSANSFAQQFVNSGRLIISGETDLNVCALSTPAVFDYDNDGDDDFFVGDTYGNIHYYECTETQTLEYVGMVEAGGNIADVGLYATPFLIDYNSDGYVDLICGNADGKVNIFLGQENGFASSFVAQTSGVDISVGVWSFPALADINGDGNLQLFVGANSGFVLVYNILSENNFEFSDTLKADGVNINPESRLHPEFSDADNDDDLDLYLGTISGRVILYLNDGNGVFSVSGQLSSSGVPIMLGSTAAPVVTDFDADGDNDLIVGSNSAYLNLFLNDGLGNYTGNEILTSINGFFFGIHASTSISDYNGDSYSDIIVGDFNGNVRLFLNDGNYQFNDMGLLRTSTSDIDVGLSAAPAFYDYDNDGDDDLFIGHSSGTIKIFRNNGNDTYTAQPDMQADGSMINLSNYTTPDFVDFDEDGDLDLLTGAWDGLIRLYINDAGAFSFWGTLKSGTNDITVSIGSDPQAFDYDNDGDLDIISGSFAGFFYLFLNDGTNNFSAGSIIQADGVNFDAGVRSKVSAADIDGVCGFELYCADQDGKIIVLRQLDDVPVNIISVHQDQTVNSLSDCSALVPDYSADLSVEDNCSWTSYQVPAAGSVIYGELNQISITVVDEGGFSDQVIFNLAVVDNTAPVFGETPEFSELLTGENCSTLIPDYTSLFEVNDNCDSEILLEQTPAAGSEIAIGEVSISISATDDSNNISYVEFSITVIDDIDPVFTSVPESDEVFVTDNCSAVIPDYLNSVTMTDNCDNNLVFSQQPAAGEIISENTIVTVRISDDSGNFAEETILVTVSDTISPVVSCPTNAIVICVEGESYYTVNGVEFDPTVFSDNCSNTSISNSFNASGSIAGAHLPQGINTIIWTVEDESGNSSTCELEIGVNAFVSIDGFGSNRLSVYPNPVVNSLYLSGISSNSIQIIGLKGDVIYSSSFNNANEVVVDFSTFPQGIYTVIVTDINGNSQQLKLIHIQ